MSSPWLLLVLFPIVLGFLAFIGVFTAVVTIGSLVMPKRKAALGESEAETLGEGAARSARSVRIGSRADRSEAIDAEFHDIP